MEVQILMCPVTKYRFLILLALITNPQRASHRLQHTRISLGRAHIWVHLLLLTTVMSFWHDSGAATLEVGLC